MKEFFSKVKTWIITHKVVSVVIAAVLVAGITLAIVLPVTLGGKKDNGDKTYTVIWKNWDGTVLEADTDVKGGSVPEYNGATPARPSEGQTAYTFKGWSPELAVVTGNATYTATYTEGVDENRIAKAGYEAYVNKIKDPICLSDLNFTTIINNVEVKVAGGKIETEKAQEYNGSRAIFVLKADTYNASTGKIGVDSYINAEVKGEMIWGHTEDTINLFDYYEGTIGSVYKWIFDAGIDYDDLKYDETENVYKYSELGSEIVIKFVNGNIARFALATDGDKYEFDFTDIGTTSITVPDNFVEADDL
ncbi:MAG: hypothetical protein IJU84_00150 [Clostridia bacterium]|nr:hypothetical protein [Clostridia bacterium]